MDSVQRYRRGMDDSDAQTIAEGPDGSSIRPGDILANRYQLEGLLGRGGMGEVYSANDIQLGRSVAVKRMRKVPNDRTVPRFVREARVQGRLEHSAIPPVYELGTDAHGHPFFVMKKLSGVTLGSIVESGRSLPERVRLLRALAEACNAVELAHVAGVVHRDLKPDNIMLGDYGEVYVLDWGVAKLLDEPELEASEKMTRVGFTVGTVGYMAPEQAKAKPDLDGRADVFSLGCILFEILAGQPLVPRGEKLAPAIVHPAMRAPDRQIPPELDALCARALAPDRAQRVQRAGELGAKLREFLDGDRDLAMRRELARAHLDRAQAAFRSIANEDQRKLAMREAGAALALDPQLFGAAELVGRLMLEPPRETPKEVAEAIRADQIATLAQNARTGVWGYLGYVAFVPALLWLGRGVDALALFLLISINVVITLIQGYVSSKPRPIRIVLGNAALIALIAHLFSPFLIAPGIAAVTAMMLVFGPSYRERAAVIGVIATMVLAIVVPWILELAGVLAATTRITTSGLSLEAPGLLLPAGATLALLVLYAIGLVTAAVGMSYAMRRAERTVREHLHLQAWQLRQLVPV